MRNRYALRKNCEAIFIYENESIVENRIKGRYLSTVYVCEVIIPCGSRSNDKVSKEKMTDGHNFGKTVSKGQNVGQSKNEDIVIILKTRFK